MKKYSGKHPWLEVDAIMWLEHHLVEDFSVFEYGSGDSTIYYAERTKNVISVEHSSKWFKKISDYLVEYNIKNVDLILKQDQGASKCCNPWLPNQRISPSLGAHPAGYPENYSSCSGDFGGKNFENYVKVINKFPDESFNLVVVDGRSRPSCLMHAQKKVKIGGYVLLDDHVRTHYKRGRDLYNNTREWEHINVGSIYVWKRLQ